MNRAAARYKDGREYFVCPAVMIRPGVLAANNGAILYPGKVLRDRPERWNDVPLTLNHPADAAGNRISARDPAARGSIIGRVAGVRFAGGKLRGEAWFDVAATPAGLLERVRSGVPVEVSTGLRTRTVSVAGVHRGKRYEKRLTGHDPDHLAVLTDEPGACSVRDGCGITSNAGFQPTRGRTGCGCGCGGGVNIPAHVEEPLPDPWNAPPGNVPGADERDEPAEPPMGLPAAW